MKPQNRIKILPYLVMNLIIAVAFQNCKQTSVPAEIPFSTESVEADGNQPSEYPTIEDSPVTVGLFPGEGPEITLFEPRNSNDSIPLLNLIIQRIDGVLGEAQFGLRGDLGSPVIKKLFCIHQYQGSPSEPFECTHLDEFILEDLQPGVHRLRVLLTTIDDEVLQSRPIVFQISE